MLLIAWETVEWCSLASSVLVFIKKVRSVHTCGLRGVWATALHNVRPFGIHFSAQEHLHTHTPHTCIMYIANVLKKCVKKLTYEKCLREIWKFGHKADLRRSSRLKLVVNATSKRPGMSSKLRMTMTMPMTTSRRRRRSTGDEESHFDCPLSCQHFN